MNTKRKNLKNSDKRISFSCGHSCDVNDDFSSIGLKNECHNGCEHTHNSRLCNCTLCDVFTASHLFQKVNETRNRLRLRLNQRNEKFNQQLQQKLKQQQQLNCPFVSKNVTTSNDIIKVKPPQTEKSNLNQNNNDIVHNHQLSMKNDCKQQSPQNNDKNPTTNKSLFNTNDIHGLLRFIEGNSNDKTADNAKKKAAKKARQRLKKEEDKQRIEEEKRLSEAAKKLEATKPKVDKSEQSNVSRKKNTQKSTTNNNSNNTNGKEKKCEQIEQTLPAIVTIKRPLENQNEPPSLVITLQGSSNLTQDKLVSALIGDYNASQHIEINSSTTTNKSVKQPQNVKATNSKSKKSKDNKEQKSAQSIKTKINSNTNNNPNESSKTVEQILAKKLKVTLTLDTTNPSINQHVNNTINMSKNQQIQKNFGLRYEEKDITENCRYDTRMQQQYQQEQYNSDLNVPLLNLPPGITITKVNGPISEKNYNNKFNPNNNNNSYSSSHGGVPVNKSGVIVVETENLIKQSTASCNNNNNNESTNHLYKTNQKTIDHNSGIVNTAANKKGNSKKKKNKMKSVNEKNSMNQSMMVRTENTKPLFSNNQQQQHTNQTKANFIEQNNHHLSIMQSDLNNSHFSTSSVSSTSSSSSSLSSSSSSQASIFTNENGMVTIRSSRLQHSMQHPMGTPILNYMSQLNPIFPMEVIPSSITNENNNNNNNYSKNNNNTTSSSLFSSKKYDSSSSSSSRRFSSSTFNAQEMLSALPGIEITKVNKSTNSSNYNNHFKQHTNEMNHFDQAAEISIIPTMMNGSERHHHHHHHHHHPDKEDWHYDNVFTPKEVLEDDMDADERELEDFKRFCQQSVPPLRKEKITHLNINDIVVNKKYDNKINGQDM